MAITDEKINTPTTRSQTPRVSDILLRPRLSEKGVALHKTKQYVFIVKKAANKIEIRKALEKFYGIKIARVNTIVVKGKERRSGRNVGTTSGFKKAVVTLTSDSKTPEVLETA